MSDQLNAFLTHLIKTSYIDPQETVHKYAAFFTNFDDSAGLDDSQTQFETKAIFSLADYLKGLTPNEYYDIAARVYSEWQEIENNEISKKLDKLWKLADQGSKQLQRDALQAWKEQRYCHKIQNENAKLREYIDSLIQENEWLSQERNVLELQTKKRNQVKHKHGIQPLRSARNSSQDRRQPSNQPFTDLSNMPIHDRLHREASHKKNQQFVNDMIKEDNELQGCTFQPLTAPGQSVMSSSRQSSLMTPQNETPFERLAKSSRKFHPDTIMSARDSEDLRSCTFKPDLNRKSKEITGGPATGQAFERLYREGEQRNAYIQQLQQLKTHTEVVGCTFQPETSKMSARLNRSGQKENEPDIHTRLYSQQKEKNRQQLLAEEQAILKMKEDYTFQPNREAKNKDSKYNLRKENSQERVTRLMLHSKVKEDKLEQKRKELDEEEERLHQIAAQSLNKSTNRSLDASQITKDQSVFSSSTNMGSRLYEASKNKQARNDQLREKIYQESGYSFTPVTNTAKDKYQQIYEKSVIERNQEFLIKKQEHIKTLEDQAKSDFKPYRQTAHSKCSSKYATGDTDHTSIEAQGAQMHQWGQEYEQRREQRKHKFEQDQQCSFKPTMSKGSEKIMRERANSGARGTSLTGRSSVKQIDIQIS